MELLHTSQAVDLRKTQQTNMKLSDKTQALYDAYRAKVPFVTKDRIFPQNLADGMDLLKNY